MERIVIVRKKIIVYFEIKCTVDDTLMLLVRTLSHNINNLLNVFSLGKQNLSDEHNKAIDAIHNKFKAFLSDLVWNPSCHNVSRFSAAVNEVILLAMSGTETTTIQLKIITELSRILHESLRDEIKQIKDRLETLPKGSWKKNFNSSIDSIDNRLNALSALKEIRTNPYAGNINTPILVLPKKFKLKLDK